MTDAVFAAVNVQGVANDAVRALATLRRAQGACALLGSVATWLPWVTLALLAAGVYVARRHRRALVGASVRCSW